MPPFQPFTVVGLLRPLSVPSLSALPSAAAVYFDLHGPTHVVLEPESLSGMKSDSFRDLARPPAWTVSWGAARALDAAAIRLFAAPSTGRLEDASRQGGSPPARVGVLTAKDGEGDPVGAAGDPAPQPARSLRFEEVSEEALQKVEAAIHREPQGYFNRLLLGRAYRHLGDYGPAEAVFASLLETPKLDTRQKARTYSELAITLREAGRIEKGLEAIGAALALKEANPIYHCEKAILLRFKGDPYAALTELDRAEALDPSNPRFAVEVAITLAEIGFLVRATSRRRADRAFEEALGYLRDVVENDPQHPRHFNELAVLLRHMGRFDEALKFHEGALALDDSHPRHHRELAETYRAMGRAEEARKADWAAEEIQGRWSDWVRKIRRSGKER